MAEQMVEGRVENSPEKPKTKKKYRDYRVYRECKYSPSCFQCPLTDCAAKISSAIYLNALPEDFVRNYHMRQLRRMRLYG